MKTALPINRARRLPQAEAAVAKGNWHEFAACGVPPLHIDHRLLPLIGQYVKDGEFGVGLELAGQYMIAMSRNAEPVENPAYLELILIWKGKNAPPVTVYLCHINGSVYFSSEPMMPF